MPSPSAFCPSTTELRVEQLAATSTFYHPATMR
jgi:hypothetical protein